VIGLVGAAACASKSGSDDQQSVKPQAPAVLDQPVRPGFERQEYRFGPVTVKGGQNNITYSGNDLPRPKVDGWINRMQINLERKDGSFPPVDVIHLHHGVLLNLSRGDYTSPGLAQRLIGAGEEKSVTWMPDGYAYKYKASDVWLLNYMLHNLFPDDEDLYLTMTFDFAPARAPEMDTITEAYPLWMDIQNPSLYPVFDVIKGSGANGEYTFPDDAADPYPGYPKPKNEWVVDREVLLLNGYGHLHPGGLRNDLWLERAGAGSTASPDASVKGDTAHVFSSKAYYYEPAGAVSWDVSVTVPPPDWRVALQRGDVLKLSVTYDSQRASWYESMGIFVLWWADGVEGMDPFQEKTDVDGELTHGHLAENDNHGNKPTGVDDPSDIPSARVAGTVSISDYIYGAGDIAEGAKSIPAVKPGESITFDNADAPKGNGVWHTLTACSAPCTAATGVAYPLADGPVAFDSGQLGNAGEPSAGRTTWTTPTDLSPGLYTYFCRIHPFMRGAFRVESG